MEFRAAHGCYDLEQKVGGNFEVDITLTVEGGDAVEVDDVSGTVNYVEVYETVREQMVTPSNIIENVAARIVDAVRTRFAQVKRVEVTVSKLAPPIGGKAAKVSVTLTK
jgi:dihydroneopterin aldolase